MLRIVREIAISLYLLVVKLFFSFFRLLPQKNKTVFVSSFGDNIFYVLKEMNDIDTEVVILNTSKRPFEFPIKAYPIVQFRETVLIDWFRSIYHLATARIIFVDNYFGFLAATTFKKDVTCIQLWHAAGAIKQFGLKDPSNKERSTRANRRFQQVYDQFDHIIVGSEKMADIMKESFGADDSRILRTGIPRTDFFYDDEAVHLVRNRLYQKIPEAQDKKVILYAPTFREQKLEHTKLMLDIEQMYKQLKDEYILLIRLHPAVKTHDTYSYPDFLYDVSSEKQMNDLLTITDVLITDYSSIPFEFSIYRKPMIFFAYDLDDYVKERGFYESYESSMPGPVVFHTNEVIRVIKNGHFSSEKIESFSEQWNEFSQGNASKNLISAVYRHMARSHAN